ncbi:MAG: hypothetical protein ACTSU2_08255 [Promethearchaeota archaeon]
MSIELGRVIKGENHITYWAQIQNKVENIEAPSPEDCAFANFVKIAKDVGDKEYIVGLIMDTLLIDRNDLRNGPRLTPEYEAQVMMYPDYIEERIKVIKILVIGYMSKNGPVHRFPNESPQLNYKVIKMTEDEIKEFHLIDGTYRMGYYPSTPGANDKSGLIYSLFLRVIDKIKRVFPDEQKDILELLKYDLQLKIKLSPFGR